MVTMVTMVTLGSLLNYVFIIDFIVGLKSREERVVGGELQPALSSGTGSSGQRRQRGGMSSFFEQEEEEVEVLVDKGGHGQSLCMI